MQNMSKASDLNQIMIAHFMLPQRTTQLNKNICALAELICQCYACLSAIVGYLVVTEQNSVLS